MSTCYTHPDCEGRFLPDRGFHGLFATRPIPKNSLVTLYMGALVNGVGLAALPSKVVMHSIQIEDDLYIAPQATEPCHYVNHSCAPNCGMGGQIAFIAMRQIAAGEEITIDYAMCDTSPYDEFTCQCGQPSCRGRVTGQDWRRPELWARYAGYFSPYIQRRIDALRAV